MSEVTKVPIPLALRHLIESNNELLKEYQIELTNKVITANEEMMRMLQLDPNEGWRLDLSLLVYVKTDPTDDSRIGQ